MSPPPSSAVALLCAGSLGDEARARLAAWAEKQGLGVSDASESVLRAAVSAFAAGHTAVVVAFQGAPEALLDLTVAELAAPMTAVIGPAGVGLALLGLTEIVSALLALDGAAPEATAEALRLAIEAGLSPVLLPILEEEFPSLV